jgi:hypothetical protein
METVSDIKKQAGNFLWVEEEKDTREIEKILDNHFKEGGSGKLIESFKMSPNKVPDKEGIEINFGSSLVIPIMEYLSKKYNEKTMLVFYRWGQKISLFSKE